MFLLSAKNMLGPVLAMAIVAPDLASAQTLFGEPDTSAPSASVGAPRASAPTPVKKHVAKKRARKPAAPKDASKVNIFNERQATLVELSLTSDTEKDAKPQIVAHDLLSGKTVTTALVKKGGCIYSVDGTFDDQSTVELSALDLCKDNNLNLIE